MKEGDAQENKVEGLNAKIHFENSFTFFLSIITHL